MGRHHPYGGSAAHAAPEKSGILGRVALVGAGRVGTALAELLRRRGHPVVAVHSRSRASAERAAALTGAPVFATLDELPPFDLVLIGVSETAIATVADALARARPGLDGAHALHFAGALGTEPLMALAGAGAAVLALHPVQACPSVEAGLGRLPGSAWGVTCAPGDRAWAGRFVGLLDGTPFHIDEADRVLWHAAAVVTSNGIAAVMGQAGRILEQLGFGSPGEILGPLAEGTVGNVLGGGMSPETLTGPVVRGEAGTVAAHVRALQHAAPSLLPGYLHVARAILETAVTSGRADGEVEARVRSVLGAEAGAGRP